MDIIDQSPCAEDRGAPTAFDCHYTFPQNPHSHKYISHTWLAPPSLDGLGNIRPPGRITSSHSLRYRSACIFCTKHLVSGRKYVNNVYIASILLLFLPGVRSEPMDVSIGLILVFGSWIFGFFVSFAVGVALWEMLKKALRISFRGVYLDCLDEMYGVEADVEDFLSVLNFKSTHKICTLGHGNQSGVVPFAKMKLDACCSGAHPMVVDELYEAFTSGAICYKFEIVNVYEVRLVRNWCLDFARHHHQDKWVVSHFEYEFQFVCALRPNTNPIKYSCDTNLVLNGANWGAVSHDEYAALYRCERLEYADRSYRGEHLVSSRPFSISNLSWRIKWHMDSAYDAAVIDSDYSDSGSESGTATTEESNGQGGVVWDESWDYQVDESVPPEYDSESEEEDVRDESVWRNVPDGYHFRLDGTDGLISGLTNGIHFWGLNGSNGEATNDDDLAARVGGRIGGGRNHVQIPAAERRRAAQRVIHGHNVDRNAHNGPPVELNVGAPRGFCCIAGCIHAEGFGVGAPLQLNAVAGAGGLPPLNGRFKWSGCEHVTCVLCASEYFHTAAYDPDVIPGNAKCPICRKMGHCRMAYFGLPDNYVGMGGFEHYLTHRRNLEAEDVPDANNPWRDVPGDDEIEAAPEVEAVIPFELRFVFEVRHHVDSRGWTPSAANIAFVAVLLGGIAHSALILASTSVLYGGHWLWCKFSSAPVEINHFDGLEAEQRWNSAISGVSPTGVSLAKKFGYGGCRNVPVYVRLAESVGNKLHPLPYGPLLHKQVHKVLQDELDRRRVNSPNYPNAVPQIFENTVHYVVQRRILVEEQRRVRGVNGNAIARNGF